MIIVPSLTLDKLRKIGVGQGLNSTVWLAHDHQLNCELALKEIDKTAFWNGNCFAEAQIVHQVSHPHVVRVQYACELGNTAGIAMPYYPKGSLTDRLKTNPLSLSESLRLGHEVLLGLAHIHSFGYIHLDIKPTNIFYDDSDRSLLADFGQARQISPLGIVSQPRMYKRTTPPEVLNTGNASFVSDIYLVGALLYRSLNGEKHWQAQLASIHTDAMLKLAIKKGKFPNRSSFLPHVPKKLRTVIRKALQVDPAGRFASCAEFQTALAKVALDCDWSVSSTSAHILTWRCSQEGCAELVVDLIRHHSKWGVEVHTEKNGSSRAKKKASLWSEFNNQEAALKWLKDVFESL